MRGFLTWGVDGYGHRHYLCRYCGKRFGSGVIFEDEIKHECKEIEKGNGPTGPTGPTATN